MYKIYIKKLFIIIFLLLFTIAGINFTVDPGNIYLKKYISEYKIKKYILELYKSKYGLVQSGWNERVVKIELSKNLYNADCVILGSSHIMQISSVRNTGNIKSQCNNLINLGVSGGSFEDLFIFSYKILNNKQLPKQIFIGIDPWTFKFNMDSRYASNIDMYKDMIYLLNLDKQKNSSFYFFKIVKNLLNKEYLLRSIKLLRDKKKEAISKNKIVYPNKKFLYDTGYEYPVTLLDGSHIYASSWIKKQKTAIKLIPFGEGNYKIYGKIFDEKTITYFEKLVSFYQNSGVIVNFLLTPYHPNIFKNGNTKTVKHIGEMEKKVKQLSEEYNIVVYGSFSPNKLLCNENEFFDFMHAKQECLNKINLGK